MDRFEKLNLSKQQGLIPSKLAKILHQFYISYAHAVEKNGFSEDCVDPLLNKFLDLVIDQLKNPYIFEPFHQRILEPFNFYQFGLDFIRPLIMYSQSRVLGLNNIKKMEEALAKGENVILFGNHQTEPDPQAISLMIEKSHPKFAEEIIFVAGHRVITDPLAAPFSKGRNLLCIFSKRHIATPPDLKEEKLLHNQRTMKKMAQLLSEGGKCIYVAPSGGRDRPSDGGVINIAPFDPQSIEMFWLIAQQSGKIAHFYPLALATYDLLPPPSSIEKEIGEHRQPRCTPIYLAFGDEIDMENIPGSSEIDKKQKRRHRAEFIWKLVAKDYANIINH